MAPVDLFIGPFIQCAEAASLGMPFEVRANTGFFFLSLQSNEESGTKSVRRESHLSFSTAKSNNATVTFYGHAARQWGTDNAKLLPFPSLLELFLSTSLAYIYRLVMPTFLFTPLLRSRFTRA